MLKTILCIPPDYQYYFPALAAPALSAFLKAHGFDCVQIDLNLAYRDHLAAKVSGSSVALDLAQRRFFLEPLLQSFFLRNLKDRYYSSLLPRANDGVFPRLPYGNNTNSSFYFCERLLDSQHLWRYLQDRQENTFLQFYVSCGIIERLEKERTAVLGISLISPSQVIAGLTLGLLVKQQLPHVHVVIGGQWPGLYADAISSRQDLFCCFDSVVLGEGEEVLCVLVGRIAAGRPLDGIDGLLLPGMSASAVRRGEASMDTLPCPDFSGLSLTDYDGMSDGRLSLTYETSRGCYWSRCAYCVDLPLPRPSYRCKQPRLAAWDMRQLKKRYGAGYLLLGDPGLSPRQMRGIARELLKERVDIRWWTMARLDPGFDRDLFELAHTAGLEKINFGFESASDRVCSLLGKGNRQQRSSRIIRDCAAAGIEVDLQTMLGLPGERFEEGMETIDFLSRHKDCISHVTFNTYYLTPGNVVFADPGRYGLSVDNAPRSPFTFFHPFTNLSGMDMHQAELLEQIYATFNRKPAETPAVPSNSGGFVELVLNGEVCRVGYCRDEATETYTFKDEDR